MVLVDVLSALRGLIKVKQKNSDIDSAVFKLHYRMTAVFLFGSCLLITCSGLIGNPIVCAHANSPYLQDKVVNTFCWIHSTYTLPKYLHEGQGSNPHAGVGQAQEDDDKLHHAYYQWVPFVLFLQALMFYTPHWLWKTWEGGKIDAIVMGMSSPMLADDDRREKISRLRDYILSTLHGHNAYAFKFLFCEVLNFINVFWQMWFLDKFLGGAFMKYGVNVIDFSEQKQSVRTDPMIVIFPRVTKCNFELFGPSGSVVKHDLMCILALNIINEKIFVFLWFWFVILTILTCISFVYRILVVCVPIIRKGLLEKRIQLKFNINLDNLTPKLQYGDYFILYLVSKNLEMLCFSRLLDELSIRASSSCSKGKVMFYLDDEDTQSLKSSQPLERPREKSRFPKLFKENV